MCLDVHYVVVTQMERDRDRRTVLVTYRDKGDSKQKTDSRGESCDDALGKLAPRRHRAPSGRGPAEP